jgi:hypothetical protein
MEDMKHGMNLRPCNVGIHFLMLIMVLISVEFVLLHALLKLYMHWSKEYSNTCWSLFLEDIKSLYR